MSDGRDHLRLDMAPGTSAGPSTCCELCPTTSRRRAAGVRRRPRSDGARAAGRAASRTNAATEAPALRIAADEDVTDAASARRARSTPPLRTRSSSNRSRRAGQDWIPPGLSPGDAVVTTSIDTGVGIGRLAAASGATYARPLDAAPAGRRPHLATLPSSGRMACRWPGLASMDEAALERYAVSRWQAP